MLRICNVFIRFFVTAASFTQKKWVKTLLTQDAESRAQKDVNMEAVHCPIKPCNP
jgi:hypothetical protein